MKISKILYLVLAVVLINSCTGSPDIVDNKTTKRVLPGYNMHVAPNAVLGPGWVYARNKKGDIKQLVKLDIETVEGAAVARNSTYNVERTFGFVANFLGVPNLDLTANGSVHDTTSMNITIQTEDTHLELIPLLTATNELKEVKEQIFNQLDVLDIDLDEYDIFMISEAVKCKKMNYTFEKKKAGDQNVDANFQKIADANQNVTWDKNNSFQLSFEMDAPLYVFYKEHKIEIEASITGETTLEVKSPTTNSSGALHIIE